MNFALALVSDTTGEVVAVMRSDVPFGPDGPSLQADGHHVVHVGAFADEATPNGVSWAGWLRASLTVDGRGAAIAFDGPTRLDEACTLEAITAASRRGRQIDARIEAWLRTVLPSETCDAMGLRRSIPISVIKALDRVRVARLNSPASSRAFVLERKTQRLSDARARKHLEARHAKAKDSPQEGSP
jgi:hypothetical protein